MTHQIEQIIKNNLSLIEERKATIKIKVDHEGKRLLNLETRPLYKKKSNLSEKDLTKIVINSTAIINRMSQFKNCGWDVSELKAQLINGISYYKENQNQEVESTKKENSKSIHPLNDKFPAQIKTLDGHFVRSKAEMLIDNFLYINNIVHAYERKIPIIENVYCDFYIPATGERPKEIYLEYWGIENDPQYLSRKKKKIEIYKKYQFTLIELTDLEIQNLEEILTHKLIKSGFMFHYPT